MEDNEGEIESGEDVRESISFKEMDEERKIRRAAEEKVMDEEERKERKRMKERKREEEERVHRRSRN